MLVNARGYLRIMLARKAYFPGGYSALLLIVEALKAPWLLVALIGFDVMHLWVSAL